MIGKTQTERAKGAAAMFYEIAQITVKPGRESDFEAGVRQALPLFRRAKGCRGLELQRSVEKPARYRLAIRWETVENHMVDFRQSADFQEWRRLVGDCFEGAPEVEHTYRVGEGF
jgi:heme-degrading monooxygenase HmoA